MPTLTSATYSGIARPKRWTGGPMGMTAYKNISATTEMRGATR